jgi:parvulin-like peptidyl-prolyl isomerase
MRWATAFGLVAFAALGVGCADGSETDGAETAPPTGEARSVPGELAADVLARIDGMVVTTSDFQQAARRRAAMRGGSLSLDERRALLDELVAETLLYQAARAEGLEQHPQVRRLMARLLYQEEIAGKVPEAIGEDELRRYYETHRNEFAVPEAVRIRRILIGVTPDRPDAAARARAEELLAKLGSDADAFVELAIEHSDDSNLPRGAESHFLRREEPPWIDRTVVERAFELEVGQLSPVFRSSDGYNILLVVERREPEQRSFEAARSSVQRKLGEAKARALYQRYVAELRKGASIEIDSARLDSIEATRPRLHPPVANPHPLNPHGSAAKPSEAESRRP